MLPKKLKFMNLLDGNKSFLNECPEVTLPDLSRNFTEYRGGGMDMPINSDMGGNALKMEWVCAGWVPEIFAEVGAQTHDAIPVRWSGAAQSDDDSEYMSIEIVGRGRHSAVSPGTSKVSEDTEIKVSTELSYYKLTIDGKDVVEIDVINMVYKRNGVDIYEGARNALGI